MYTIIFLHGMNYIFMCYFSTLVKGTTLVLKWIQNVRQWLMSDGICFNTCIDMDRRVRPFKNLLLWKPHENIWSILNADSNVIIVEGWYSDFRASHTDPLPLIYKYTPRQATVCVAWGMGLNCMITEWKWQHKCMFRPSTAEREWWCHLQY